MNEIHAHEIDALVTIGGDGSLAIANALYKEGLRVVGAPKTIDNDLDKTVITFGFDTAVHFAAECMDRLHAAAQAHRRVMVVEEGKLGGVEEKVASASAQKPRSKGNLAGLCCNL